MSCKLTARGRKQLTSELSSVSGKVTNKEAAIQREELEKDQKVQEDARDNVFQKKKNAIQEGDQTENIGRRTTAAVPSAHGAEGSQRESVSKAQWNGRSACEASIATS